MRKKIAFALALVCLLCLAGCNKVNILGVLPEETNIDFPFELDEVENVEMYHYVGTPGFVEKKVVVAEEDIETLYEMFEGLTLVVKEAEATAGVETTSFRFNLSDGTNYELVYVGYGVKNGELISSTGGYKYFTSASVGWYWEFLDKELEAVEVDKEERPK